MSVVRVLEVSVPRLCGAVRESRARHFVSIARVRVSIRVADLDDDGLEVFASFLFLACCE